MRQPVIAIHGGAGAISRAAMSADKERNIWMPWRASSPPARRCWPAAAAIDAVTEAVRLLEDCPLFNAGHGAVFTSAGTHELDAAIMDGATLRSSAIANVDCVRNPVRAARAVSGTEQACVLRRRGRSPAREHGLELVDPDYFSTEAMARATVAGTARTPGAAVLDHDQALVTTASRPRRSAGCRQEIRHGGRGGAGRARQPGRGDLHRGITNKQVGRVGDAR